MIALAVVVFALMIGETLRATGNEHRQRARGGIEPGGDVYPWMRIAYPATFLAMLVEGAIRGAPSPQTAGIGAAVFVLAKILKWWAIVSLGPAWTFRIIVVPGSRLVASGPYRWLRHPNYVAVVGELVGVALMTGARFAGPVATVAFGLLMMKRVAVENSALDAILRRGELSTTVDAEDTEEPTG